MFFLPNNQKIDEDGVIDAMLDTDMSRQYFLDTTTGEVGCVVQKAKHKPVLDPKRYLQVVRIPPATQLRWARDFAKWCVDDQAVKTSLLAEAKKKDANKAFVRCEKILQADPDEFMYGWREWQGTAGFDEMKLWLATLPFYIQEKFEGCVDCEMCKLMEQGEHNLGDFLEAKQKEERKKSKSG